jgi:hypothetical protein
MGGEAAGGYENWLTELAIKAMQIAAEQGGEDFSHVMLRAHKTHSST